MIDYHKVLGVAYSANCDEIRRAWKLRAKRCHPDKGGNTDEFIAISKAYHMLITTAPKPKPKTTCCDYCLGLGESIIGKCPKCKGEGVVNCG